MAPLIAVALVSPGLMSTVRRMEENIIVLTKIICTGEKAGHLLGSWWWVVARDVNGTSRIFTVPREGPSPEYDETRISKSYAFRHIIQHFQKFCFDTRIYKTILLFSGFDDPMKMQNDIREDM